MRGLVLLFVLLNPVAWAAQSLWRIESASVTFAIKNAGLPVRGSFGGLEAELQFDPENLARSTMVASVDASTISTGIAFRDRHLRKREYFHVDQFPRIQMELLRLETLTAREHRATFALTLKGVTRETAVRLTFAPRGHRASLAGDFVINRLDFKIGRPSAILADDVVVVVKLELERQETPFTRAHPLTRVSSQPLFVGNWIFRRQPAGCWWSPRRGKPFQNPDFG